MQSTTPHEFELQGRVAVEPLASAQGTPPPLSGVVITNVEVWTPPLHDAEQVPSRKIPEQFTVEPPIVQEHNCGVLPEVQ
jgi:hypothetical protein